jgi:hypothetical protein
MCKENERPAFDLWEQVLLAQTRETQADWSSDTQFHVRVQTTG